MTNGGGIHHAARKKASAKKKQGKTPARHKPAKALLTKGITTRPS